MYKLLSCVIDICITSCPQCSVKMMYAVSSVLYWTDVRPFLHYLVFYKIMYYNDRLADPEDRVSRLDYPFLRRYSKCVLILFGELKFDNFI